MSTYDKSIFKAAQAINNRNRKWAQEREQQAQRAQLIQSIGGAATNVIGAYGIRQQQNAQQQGNAQLLGQLGVQGLDPKLAGQMNSSQLVSALLAKRQQDEQQAATAQFLQSQGYDSVPGNVDPSILSAIVRSKSSGETFKPTTDLMPYAGGLESVPSNAAPDIIRAYNQAKARQQYDGKYYVTTDAAGNQIAIPITDKTAGSAITAGTGLVKGDRANQTREDIANATIEGRMSVAEMQQRAANQRNAATIEGRQRIAVLANENRAQLKAIDAQIAAGNRDAALQRVREQIAMRQAQLDGAMQRAQLASDTDIVQSSLMSFNRQDRTAPVVTEAEQRLMNRQQPPPSSAVEPNDYESQVLDQYDAAVKEGSEDDFLNDPDFAPIIKKFRIVIK